jgi:tetratricopeptide (TPR) repeat protein
MSTPDESERSPPISGRGPPSSPGRDESEETEEADLRPLGTPPPPLIVGDVLGERYVLQRLLGQGGNGVVFAALDLLLRELVAIKVLRAQDTGRRHWLKRLAREVRLARAIRHANVCRVFELGQVQGHSFLIAELATGGTLRELLRDRAAELSWPERLALGRAACAGLSAIHAVGIIHRDVTPQNMLIMGDGRLAITDFGLAIGEKESTTVHGGTPTYLPPEVAMGERSDQRSDVWQLGSILHEVLFGRRPEWKVSGERRTLKPPVNDDAPAVEVELARLCADCLALAPSLRPPSAVAVAGRFAAAEAARPRGWLARRWARLRHLAVRQWRGAAALTIVIAAALGGLRAVEHARRPQLCGGAPQKLVGVWDAPVKAAIASAFARARAPFAGEALEHVTASLDRYAGGWAAAYVDACEATHVRGEQSPEVLDLRMSCLGARLGELKALTAVLRDADDEVVAHAAKASAALGGIERCSDVPLLRAVVPPPEGDERVRVAELRTRLAEVKALGDAGRTRESLQRIDQVVRDAQAVGYTPLVAEALFRQGLLQHHADPTSAPSTLEQALWAAEAGRDDELAAESATELVYAYTYRDAQYEQATRWQHMAEAILRRIGGHELTQAWLANNVSSLMARQNRGAEALAFAQKALALKEHIAGIEPYDVALSVGNVGLALESLGRHEEALAATDRALALLRGAIGARHPEVAIQLNNRGEILNVMGRHAEARRAFEEALDIWRTSFGADSYWTAYALTGMGLAHLGQHQPDDAVPLLERALAIRERTESDASLLGDTRFALARALAEAGREPERARRLARAARDDYARAASLPQKVAEIDGWLARTPGARRPPG